MEREMVIIVRKVAIFLFALARKIGEEVMDGDEVGEVVELLKIELNHINGNLTDTEYEEAMGTITID